MMKKTPIPWLVVGMDLDGTTDFGRTWIVGLAMCLHYQTWHLHVLLDAFAEIERRGGLHE